MAVKCGDKCPQVCDACLYYAYNGDQEGCYTGDGWCNKFNCPEEPWSDCPFFHCRTVPPPSERP